MRLDFDTKYQVGSVEIDLIITFKYIAGRPATREEPEDPPEIDILMIWYKLRDADRYDMLMKQEVLYQIIYDDDDLALRIMSNVDGEEDSAA